MSSIDFEREHTYSEDKIVLPVRIARAPLFELRMVLDTGATVSTMGMSMLSVLGITSVETGRFGSITTANGEEAPCWIHRVDIELLDRPLTIDVAFTPTWRVRNLLGMRGFMDQLVFAVDHHARRLYLKWR